jgi:hypothetical protein
LLLSLIFKVLTARDPSRPKALVQVAHFKRQQVDAVHANYKVLDFELNMVGLCLSGLSYPLKLAELILKIPLHFRKSVFIQL